MSFKVVYRKIGLPEGRFCDVGEVGMFNHSSPLARSPTLPIFPPRGPPRLAISPRSQDRPAPRSRYRRCSSATSIDGRTPAVGKPLCSHPLYPLVSARQSHCSPSLRIPSCVADRHLRRTPLRNAWWLSETSSSARRLDRSTQPGRNDCRGTADACLGWYRMASSGRLGVAAGDRCFGRIGSSSAELPTSSEEKRVRCR